MITEFSAVGPTAAGTAPRPRVENGGALEVDPTADPNFCTQCGWVHQERERKVPCVICHRRWTPSFHAVCDHCKEYVT